VRRSVRLNPRQRRGLVLLAVAAIGAVGSFTSLRAYVADVRSAVGPLAPVLQLSRDVAVNRPVEAADTTVVRVPRRWLPDTAVADVSEIQGLVAAAPLRAGSYLQSDMVGPPPQLLPGQRSVLLAVPPDSIAGEVRAGDRIDVLAALDKQRTGAGVSGSRIVVNAALVLGVVRVATGAGAADGDDSASQVRLTLALSAAESQALNWAQSVATKLSVSLVGPDSAPVPAPARDFTPDPTASPSRGAKR